MNYLHVEEASGPSTASDQIPSRSISDWRSLFATTREGSEDIFRLEDEDHRIHRLTFKPWAGRNPDETYLIVGFRKYNPAIYGVGKAHPIPPVGPYDLT